MSQSLKIHDRIYGDVEIESPVILALIASKSLQRLKEINQFGIPDKYYHLTNYSRFEHSIGVMLLLKYLGATDEEQIAGLIHDVSHLAFSHIYDWVVEDHTKTGGKEDSQDLRHAKFVSTTEIPVILSKYGYDVDKITNYQHFGLLERDSPDLCADRVDYSLREFTPARAQQVLSNLTTAQGMIVCKNKTGAQIFAKAFLALQENHWGARETTLRYQYFSESLRRGLNLGIITVADFEVNDQYLISKMETTTDESIQKILTILQNKDLSLVSQGKMVFKKFRYIDPPFKQGQKVIRLSEEDASFKKLLEEAREKNGKGVLI